VHPLWKERLSFSFRQPREIGLLLVIGLVLGNVVSVITCATFTGMNNVPFLLVWTLTIIGTVLLLLLIHIVNLLYKEDLEEDAMIRDSMQTRLQLNADSVLDKEMKHIIFLQKTIAEVAKNGHMEIAKEMEDVFQLLYVVVTTFKMNASEENYIKNTLPIDFINILHSYQKNTVLVQQRELDSLILLIQNKKTYIQENYIEKYHMEKVN